MTYQINDLDDGRCELVEIRTTSLGILTSRRIAERFADWLDAQDEEGLQQLAEIALVESDEADFSRETVFSPGDIPLLDPVPAAPAVPDEIEPAAPQEVAAPISGGGAAMPVKRRWRRRCAGLRAANSLVSSPTRSDSPWQSCGGSGPTATGAGRLPRRIPGRSSHARVAGVNTGPARRMRVFVPAAPAIWGGADA